MKASELSIGDWVKVLNYYWDGSPYIGQVNGIVNIRGTYYLQFEDALSAGIDRCEPIPITPEILEKNGFSGEGYAILKLNDNSWMEYYYHDLRLRKWWEGVDEWLNDAKAKDITFQCHCYYVHELQHALRLAGVEKDVVV